RRTPADPRERDDSARGRCRPPPAAPGIPATARRRPRRAGTTAALPCHRTTDGRAFPAPTARAAPAPSADEEAAVRRQPLPGGERRLVGGQEQGGGRDLARLADAAHRRAAQERLARQLRDRRG